MQVLNHNNVKIYNLTQGKTIPDWLSERKKRLYLKSDVSLQKRIQLIQDFEMPVNSQCIEVTPDQSHIYVSGVYPPRLRCYNVRELSMKFERGMDSEVVAFKILSDDWTKLVLLQDNRFIEFQTRDGIYYKTRIPTYGRDIAYYNRAAELFVAATGSDVYRLNLCKGTFMSPITTTSGGINKAHVHPLHSLLFLGSDSGTVECWDPRSRARVALLHVPNCKNISALQTNKSLDLAVGTEAGEVILYDIRSQHPLLTKDHYYNQPINSIFYHETDHQNLVISACSKSFKIWHRDNGSPYTAIETDDVIRDVAWFSGTGMFCFASEGQKMQTFYIPEIGPAPQWCWFLDNLTEELEESLENTVYDDYKFVTKEDLNALGLGHLMGTNYLRAYMHGFFIDMRLYCKAREVVNPFAFETYKKELINQKVKDQSKDRVDVKKLPQINKALAKKDISKGSKIMEDNRFSALFSNPDFEVDEESEQFKLINPTVKKHEKESDFTEYVFDDHDDEDDDEEFEEHLKRLKKLKKKKEMKIVSVENSNVGLTSSKTRPPDSLLLGERFSSAANTTIKTKRAMGAMVFSQTETETEARSRGEREAKKGSHERERRQLGRSAKGIMKKQKGKFWRGRKVG